MEGNALLIVIVAIVITVVIVHSFFYLIGRNRTLQDRLANSNNNSPAQTPIVIQAAAQSKHENGYTAKPLSARELEVAALVVAGLGNKEIAANLNISPYTVNNHLENIKEKTGSRNKAELVSHLLKNGIID